MKTSFQSLITSSPNIVKNNIFTLLDPRTQLKGRIVCKSFKRLLDQIIPFRVILNEQSYPYLDIFLKSHKVGEIAVGFFSQSYPEQGWNLEPEALTILSNYYKCPLFNQCPTPATSLDILPKAKLEQLFTEFCNVTHLTVASSALVDIQRDSFLRTLEIPNLKFLDLLVEGNRGLTAIQDILSQTYPNLKTLSITIKHDDDLTLYADVYSFVGRHPSITKVHRSVVSCLTKKSHHFDRSKNPEDCSLSFMQIDHRLEPILYANVLQSLGQANKLTHLELYILTSEGRARKNLELKLLRAQVTLSTLELHNIRSENMPVWRTVPPILQQCSGTLKSVVLDGCFCDRSIEDHPGPFWSHWVEHCIHLERLEVLICGIKVVDVSVIPKDNLKILCLGHTLTQRQMRTICDTFIHLEELSFPQMNSNVDLYANLNNNDADDVNGSSRVVTIFQFKRACNLSKLRKLTLFSKSCKLKSIRKFASLLMGIYENCLGSMFIPGSKRGDLEYTIDRTLFSCPS